MNGTGEMVRIEMAIKITAAFPMIHKKGTLAIKVTTPARTAPARNR